MSELTIMGLPWPYGQQYHEEDEPKSIRLDFGETQFGKSVHWVVRVRTDFGNMDAACGRRLDIVEHWRQEIVFDDRPSNLCPQCEHVLNEKYHFLWLGPRKIEVP